MNDRRLPDDWFDGFVPANATVHNDAWIDSTYSLSACHSRETTGLSLGRGSGIYAQALLQIGPNGRFDIGEFSCLNASNIVCNERITIGSHCFVSWGVLISDSEVTTASVTARSTAMTTAATFGERHFPVAMKPNPVTIEDNVWIGFGSIILPGVTIGRGCVVGCRSIVSADVGPYHVVAGTPLRTIRVLEATDDEQTRQRVIQEFANA